MIPFDLASRLNIFTLAGKLQQSLTHQDVIKAQDIGILALAFSERKIVSAANAGSKIDATNQTVLFTFFVVWLIGMIACAMFFIIIHLKYRQEYTMALPLENDCLFRMIRTGIPETSGRRIGFIRTAYRHDPDNLHSAKYCFPPQRDFLFRDTFEHSIFPDILSSPDTPIPN